MSDVQNVIESLEIRAERGKLNEYAFVIAGLKAMDILVDKLEALRKVIEDKSMYSGV